MTATGQVSSRRTEWGDRAADDAPHAFRAVVRATIEGAEGAEESLANQCGAIIFGLVTQGDYERLTPILARLVVEANGADFADASETPGSGDFLAAYGLVFVEQFMLAAEQFRTSGGNVGEYLDAGERDRERVWRNALTSVGTLVLGGARERPGTRGIQPTKYVLYHYCISLGIVSFRRTSGVKAIPPGRSALLAGLPYTLLSLVGGWWGIPWGPIWTIEAVARNLGGGTDVTDAVYPAFA